MKKIGMVGLGAMGRGIAENILRAGRFELFIYDVRPEAMEPLAALGARPCADLAALGRQAEAVLMMVNTYPQCRSVLEGLAAGMRGGAVVNMSTIAMDEARALADWAAERGIAMLDCPVSGGTAGAGKGSLTLMAAGPDELLEACRPVLECFSANITHVGTEPGQGQAVKTINQLLVGVHMCAAAEAFTLARKCGLDLETVYDVICRSAGMSRIFENRGRFAMEHDYSTRSTLQIQLKDTSIVCRTAEAVGAPAILAQAARELFRLSVGKYPPTQDSLAVMRLYEELAGMEE